VEVEVVEEGAPGQDKMEVVVDQDLEHCQRELISELVEGEAQDHADQFQIYLLSILRNRCIWND
jgi:hypothetical protein